MHGSLPPNISICIPVLDDWAAVRQLISEIDNALFDYGATADVVIVDDRSISAEPNVAAGALLAIRRMEVVRLRRNLGHQRAIAAGLSYIHDHRQSDMVVVMDGDGEDRAESLPMLIDRYRACNGSRIIFAARGKRQTHLLFQWCYQAYRLTHRLLTGHSVAFGNYSVIPRRHLHSLVGVSELWNHYAASVVKARIPFDTVVIDRGRRISGRSKMSFVSLLGHGLSAVSVFADVVGLRMLIASMGLAASSLGAIVTVVIVRFATDLAIPGWATTAVGLLLVVFLQTLLISLVFVFMTLQGRNGSTFIPIRDYGHFIDDVTAIPIEPNTIIARRSA